jgi:hypothetical protein
MRSKPPRWAIRRCSEPEDDTDTIAASALRDKLAGCVVRSADRRDDSRRAAKQQRTHCRAPCIQANVERRLTKAIAGVQADGLN